MSDQSADTTAADLPEVARKRGWFGHPPGLWNLAGVEMWERFSFYGMQAILAFYLYYSLTDGGLGMSEKAAYSIVGAYGGLVYLSAVLGGWVADRLLGSERTLTYGAVLIMFGHIALAAISGIAGVAVGLVCVAIGAGTLKATTSSVVGEMYAKGDVRRDAGFSIYYMGVNLGSLFGPLVTGALWGWRGFHWGFAAAAIGMALGLVQYLLLRRRTIGDIGRRPTNPLARAEMPRYLLAATVVVAAIAIAALAGWLQAERLADIVAVVTVIAAIVLFAVILTSKRTTPVEHSRVVSFIPMFFASATFWSLFQQQFTIIVVYADKRLDRHLFGWELSPAWVNSINPIFIVILAGVFAAMWTKLGNKQPSTPLKFAAGTFLMGIAFWLFIPYAGGGPNSTPLAWIVLILLFFTLAELCLSPVGQSLVTKLAPEAFKTQMIALYFLSIAVGSSMSGLLAKYYTEETEVSYSLWVGGAAIVVAALMVVMNKWIVKKMAGVR